MNTPTPPGLPRRLAALLYDSLLIVPLIMLVVAIATAVQFAVTGDAADDGALLHPTIVQLLAVLTAVSFYLVFWRRQGQTLGMQAWRIRLRSLDGGAIGTRQMLARCLGALVSLAPAGMGFWWCLFDRRQHYWHDYWSGTELELLPAR